MASSPDGQAAENTSATDVAPASGPSALIIAPTSGPTGSAATVTAQSTLANVTEVEVGTSAQISSGSAAQLVPCQNGAVTGCFNYDTNVDKLDIPAMPAEANGAYSVEAVVSGAYSTTSYTYTSAPAAPTVTAALGSGAGTATVSWTAGAQNGATNTGWSVTPVDNGVSGTAQNIAAGTTTANFTGLNNGDSYTFQVVENTASDGPSGVGVSNSVTMPTAPSSAGTVGGTPTVTGTFNFTAQVTDTGGATASQAETLVVNPGPAFTTTSPLGGGEVGAAYSQSLASTGGTGPYSYSVTSGGLPNGLTLASSGVISGLPTVSGTFSFTAKTLDAVGGQASQSFSITVVAAPTITTTSLTGGEVGASYSATLSVSNGTSPYAWTLTIGALPTGTSLSSAGAITGTPTATGTYNFTVEVTDGAGQMASHNESINVIAAPTITTSATLPTGEQGIAYNQSLAATGGSGGYQWAVTAGALPAGLTLGAGGSLTGTPTVSGNFSFTVQVTDSAGSAVTQAESLAVLAAPSITTTVIPDGVVGSTTYNLTLGVTGGTAPYTFSVSSGSLPPGLSLSSSGQLTGVPTVVGTFPFTVSMQDALGSTAYTVSYSVVEGQSYVPSHQTSTTPVSLPPGTTSSGYDTTLPSPSGATGSSPTPWTWTVTSGSLPAGVTLSSGGVLSGTPTVPGTYAVTVTASDGMGDTYTETLTISVAAPASLVPSGGSATDATAFSAGNPGSVVLPVPTGAGSGAGPVSSNTWTVVGGSLPKGISVSSGGVISGTAIVPGVYVVQVEVKGASGTVAETLTITVYPTNLNSRPMASTPDDAGYWVAAANGSVKAFGDADLYGTMAGRHLAAPIIDMAATADGRGYWLLGSDGGVFAFGDAHFYGSTVGKHLSAPVIAMTVTPAGAGYWLVGSNGGVYAFGDAHFFGSATNLHLDEEMVGLAAKPDGTGYWLVAGDGGVFAYGSASFDGNAKHLKLVGAIVGVAATPSGRGYWLVGKDGGVFSYGDAHFFGSLGLHGSPQPILGMVATETGGGYWLVGQHGAVSTFGDASYFGSAAAQLQPHR